MVKYILSAMCVLSVFLGCERTPIVTVEKQLPKNVEMVANAEVRAQGRAWDVTVMSVHDDKRGVTCYISYPGDVQMTCLPDVWLSGKMPMPPVAPQDAQQVK